MESNDCYNIYAIQALAGDILSKQKLHLRPKNFFCLRINSPWIESGTLRTLSTMLLPNENTNSVRNSGDTVRRSRCDVTYIRGAHQVPCCKCAVTLIVYTVSLSLLTYLYASASINKELIFILFGGSSLIYTTNIDLSKTFT